MKAIIYTRKSTDRKDTQVQSLDDQLKWCEDTAKSLGYEVVETISESYVREKSRDAPWIQKDAENVKRWGGR